ncbi:hypothetical protein B0H13DRAFT_2084024 [Mycena leptocephala]|nr:hypothetical protein B0H13DRAFT_2084024 [Mycena leptocephala]
MSFPLQNTSISGGNFYSVAGNINQVFNAHLEANPDQQQVAEHAAQCMLFSEGRPKRIYLPTAALVIRSQRRPREEIGRPYAVPNRSQAQGSVSSQEGHNDVSSNDTHMPGGRMGRIDHDPTVRDDDDFSHPAQLQNHHSATDHMNNTYSVGGDMTQIKFTSYGESGIDILHRSVVMEAFGMDEDEWGFSEPPCDYGTREAIAQDLRAWSQAKSNEANVKPILWLHGAAGMGKSFIAGRFTQECRAHASFFFKRGHSKLGMWGGLVATIAYQLADLAPKFSAALRQVIERDKMVIDRSIPVQFQALLVEPFMAMSDPEFRPVVVLDGLDECADHKHQQKILLLLIIAIRDGLLPMRLLISSRPEPHLREILEDAEVVPLCRPMVLSADESAYNDIRIYLRNEFRRIHTEFTGRGINLGEIWPSTDTVEQLVKRSSGVFIYATTVIRFVEDEYSHPVDRLAAVMALAPESIAPLDALYTEILSKLPQGPAQLRVLRAILHPEESLHLVLEDVDIVLGLSQGTSRLMLRALHSLVQVPPIQIPMVEEEFVYSLHASFPDFLCDARRSMKWCIVDPWLRVDLLESVIRFLSNPSFAYRRWIRRTVITALPRLLHDITPSNALITLLRNTHFQESIFIDTHEEHEGHLQWPKDDSPYPTDLVQLWADRSWIGDFAFQICGCRSFNDTKATFKFDSLYARTFSQHPDALLLMRAVILHDHIRKRSMAAKTTGGYRMPPKPLPPSPVWDTLQLSFNTLKPFLAWRDLGYSCFQKWDSPLAFLKDRDRAGGFYADLEQIIEQWLLCWVRFARQPQDSNGEMLDSIRFGFTVMQHCGPSQILLRELETLDLAYPCRQPDLDRVAHGNMHEEYIDAHDFNTVLKWLSKFPEPLAAKAHVFWKGQLADVTRCINLCT